MTKQSIKELAAEIIAYYRRDIEYSSLQAHNAVSALSKRGDEFFKKERQNEFDLAEDYDTMGLIAMELGRTLRDNANKIRNCREAIDRISAIAKDVG